MRKAKTAKSDRISFQYIKSNFFRVIHADGIHGGVSPNLDIHMAVFSERQPIPKEVVHVVSSDGTLGPEDLSARIARKGVVREVDADLVLDLNVAKSVVKWLQQKIDLAENILKDKQQKFQRLQKNNDKGQK